MKLTAAIIEGFVNGVLKKNFDGAAETPECHREWWDLFCSSQPKVAIAAPRGHAKSTAITHACTLAAICFRWKRYVIIVSDTEGQAILFLQDIKKEFEDNTELQKLFGLRLDVRGQVKWKKDHESDLIGEFEDGAQFRISARGSEQKVRGLKWGSLRPDLIIGDDLENDEIVLNKDRREKFRRWFLGALVPCLADHGCIRVVGTILHMDSLLNRLMPEGQLIGKNKKLFLKMEGLKEFATKRTPWKSIRYEAHNEDFSLILWPGKKTREEFERIRADYAAQGLPEVYSQEYLNRPIDESVSYFRRQDFTPMTDGDMKTLKSFYITVDLAVSEKERADYTVFVVGGRDQNGMLHVQHVVRDRMDGMEVVDLLLQLHKNYEPEAIGVEDGVISKSLLPFLREQMLIRGIFPNLVMMKSSQDKQTRARSIQARMRAGGVRFNKDAEWYQTLEEECMRFPRDRHDDQVDALAYLGLLLDQMIDAPTKAELANEEFEEFSDTFYSDLGKNPITGY